MKDKTQSPAKITPKQNVVLVVISWFFGVLFIMTGISIMWEDAIFGVSYLMSGILLLPLLNGVLRGKIRIILFILLMVVISARILWSFWYLFFPAVPHLIK